MFFVPLVILAHALRMGRGLAMLIIIGYEVMDVFCWKFCDEPLCGKFLALLDPYAGVVDYPFYAAMSFFAALAVVAVVFMLPRLGGG